jgi:hypothetical protein
MSWYASGNIDANDKAAIEPEQGCPGEQLMLATRGLLCHANQA